MTILKTFTEKLKGVKEGALLALAMCFMVLIYAPIEIYSYNQDEFWYDMYDLIPIFTLMFVAAFLLLVILAVLVSSFNRKLYNAIFVFGTIGFISTYIQGNFMVGNLPRMDGTVVNWADYAKDKVYSLVLWLVVTIIVCVLVKLISCAKYIKIAGAVALCMTLMFALTLCSIVFTTKSYRGKLNAITTTESMFEMSQDTNFVIMVLDSTDSKTLYELIQSDDRYQSMFENFTYFSNTLGAYPYTKFSLPYILTGEYYQNDEPFDEFNIRAYQASRLFNNLEDSGYDVNVFADYDVLPKNDANLFSFDNHHNEFKIGSYSRFAKLQLKLVGLRYAPYQLKEKCMISTDWFDELMVVEGDASAFSEDNIDFYQSMQTQPVTYKEEPCFKYIHLEGAHLPFRYDKDMNVVESSDYVQCVEASMTLACEYLAKLNDAGVYDNTAIIIMADHGYSQELVSESAFSRQDPILLVKGKGERHPFTISDAPISFEDLQEAYERLMNGSSSTESFDYKDGEERTRRYLYYFYGDDKHMYEYMHEGWASDDTMYPTGNEYFYEE